MDVSALRLDDNFCDFMLDIIQVGGESPNLPGGIDLSPLQSQRWE
jgi:hypothetical protein